MPAKSVSTRAELGSRIAEARNSLGKSQTELAEALGLDRTVLNKIERGQRELKATELVKLADQLGRPLDWFLFESPPAIVSRRRDPAVEISVELDRSFENLSRDVEFLLDRGLLTVADHPTSEMPTTFDAVIELAAGIRRLLEHPEGPLYDLQDACEHLGLLAFSLQLGRDNGDAVYAEVGDAGVALLNGSTDPGRRRFTLAHELGHHLVGDAYEPSDLSNSVDDTEKLLNAFAAHFLMPGDSIRQLWETDTEHSVRLKTLAVATRFRVSWTAACGQLGNLRLVSQQTVQSLLAADPEPWESLELGERWASELTAPSVPQDYARQIIEAYRSHHLTAAKTLELLHGTLPAAGLPPVHGVDEGALVEALRRRP